MRPAVDLSLPVPRVMLKIFNNWKIRGSTYLHGWQLFKNRILKVPDVPADNLLALACGKVKGA